MGGVADGETTNEMSGLIGGGGCHWVIGGWCRGQKKTPTSHKDSLEGNGGGGRQHGGCREHQQVVRTCWW